MARSSHVAGDVSAMIYVPSNASCKKTHRSARKLPTVNRQPSGRCVVKTQPPAANSTPKRKRAFPRTDAGNAEAFVALYKDDLRYDHKRKLWLFWKEHRWVEDPDESSPDG